LSLVERKEDKFHFLKEMEKLVSVNTKKGQVSSLAPAMISLVFAAVILVFGLIISQTLRNMDVMMSDGAKTNETQAWLNNSGYTLSVEEGDKTGNYAITAVWLYNGTEVSGGYKYNVSMSAANIALNFTVNNSGIVTNISPYINKNISISYTYKSGGEAWTSANKTTEGLGTFADFWEIIVLAIVITVIIGLLLTVFGGRKER
jgi:hypothetical protein